MMRSSAKERDDSFRDRKWGKRRLSLRHLIAGCMRAPSIPPTASPKATTQQRRVAWVARAATAKVLPPD